MSDRQLPVARLTAVREVAASERAHALFEAARRQALEVTVTTLATTNEAKMQLRETADLPTLPPGLRDIFLRLAARIEADLMTARAILERS